MLIAEGHDAVGADSGQEGIDAFSTALSTALPFDVVMTDLTMQGVDGKQVARSVKKLSPSTPTILMTGWDVGTSGDATAYRDIDHVLGKPTRLAELRQVMRQCGMVRGGGSG